MDTINPFTWEREIDHGVGRDAFAKEVTLMLKGGTNVALFGPRGTGKTSFTISLERELAKDHGDDAPPWPMIRIDLRPVVSLETFVSAIADGVTRHPDGRITRKIKAEFDALNKEFGINLGVAKFAIGKSPTTETVSAILTKQLRALRQVAPKLVVSFDEFQRLASCPGDPLSVIRTVLMSRDTKQETSLLLTGSLRQRLEMVIHDSTQPIWDQTFDVDLPPIPREVFSEYLEGRFEATNKPIESDATDRLVDLTEAHPKRTQQVAWITWQRAAQGTEITSTDVSEAFSELVTNKALPGRDFAVTYDNWLNGDETEINNARVLLLLANGGAPGSPKDATRFGFANHAAASRAAQRMTERGYVERTEDGQYRIVDPLFREFLRNQPEGDWL